MAFSPEVRKTIAEGASTARLEKTLIARQAVPIPAKFCPGAGAIRSASGG